MANHEIPLPETVGQPEVTISEFKESHTFKCVDGEHILRLHFPLIYQLHGFIAALSPVDIDGDNDKTITKFWIGCYFCQPNYLRNLEPIGGSPLEQLHKHMREVHIDNPLVDKEQLVKA